MNTLLKALSLIFIVFSVKIANAEVRVVTPTTYSNMHWRVSAAPTMTNCPSMTDMYLDLTGATNTGIYAATGLVLCNTSSGSMNIMGNGTALVGSSFGLGLNVIFSDVRLFCTLPLSTLNNANCSLYDVASGVLLSNSVSLTYVP